MNLYKISQDVNNGYDTHDSAVVAAENEEEARNTHPSCGEWGEIWSTWAERPDQVKVELLGVAKEGTNARVILSSFNAG